MGARSRCFLVPCVALLLATASVRAQDSGLTTALPPLPPADQPSSVRAQDSGSMIEQPAGEACLPCPCGPSFYFQADWLWTSRAGEWSNTRNFINGPDAASFDDLPGFTGDNGYRLQGGVRIRNWIFECVYSHYGDWESSLNRNVDGVAFNPAASNAGGDWAGRNSINGSTYFTPIANAANLTTPVNTAGDQSGLGPSTTFATDAKPALMAYSHSDFYMTEANVKGADYLFPLWGRGLRMGVGYVNANFNNNAWVALSGTFRAVNAGGTVSLPNSVLTAPTGGDLTLYAGGGTGFTDGISNNNGGAETVPSQLLLTHSANTRNELNGAQLVLDADLLELQHLEFGATLKAGMFDNFAQGTITETYSETNNDLSAYYRRFTDSCHQLAFMGGVGVDASYHLTDEIAICAGYDVLFLSNLALGQEQINGVSNSWYHVQTNGTATIQSVRTGLEIDF
jgi:hypothetical protein